MTYEPTIDSKLITLLNVCTSSMLCAITLTGNIHFFVRYSLWKLSLLSVAISSLFVGFFQFRTR